MYDFTTIGAMIGLAVKDADIEVSDAKLPGFLQAILGPLVVIVLLALRPVAGVAIDPLIALPLGGMVCTLTTGNMNRVVPFMEFGLSKVIGVP